MKSELQIGVEKLCTELKNDPSFFYSWQSNIAMAFRDEYERQVVRPGFAAPVHVIANNAAINFLNTLIILHAQPHNDEE